MCPRLGVGVMLIRNGKIMNDARLVSVPEEFSGDAQFVTVGMLSEEFDGEPHVKEDKIIEWKWWPLDNLPKNFFMPTKNMINNCFAGKIHSGESSGKEK